VGAHLRSVDPAATETADGDHAPLLQLLNDVHHRMVTRAAAAVAGSARLDEWAVLTVLSDGVEHPMSQIAELTHTPPPTLTKLVDRMVASGLVYRRTDSVDRRRVFAFSTARGQQRHRRLQSLIDAAHTDLSDDNQLCELVDEVHRRVASNPEPVVTSSEVVQAAPIPSATWICRAMAEWPGFVGARNSAQRR